MAINVNDFEKVKYQTGGRNSTSVTPPNLFVSKKEDTVKGYKYLARFSHQGKIYTKILGYSKKDNLTPRKATELLEVYKKDIEDGYTSTANITLDKLFGIYFETLDSTKQWTKKQRYIYEHYIKKHIGKRNIEKLREMDVKKILLNMSREGLSPRTQKSLLEVLKPMFNFAIKNKFLKENPIIDLNVKIPNQKKIVTNATELFNQVYKGITTLYKDEAFYQALFLFGFTGRRKTEILTLKWENIDFTNDYYWIEDTKNDDKQKYELPKMIKTQLLKINDTRRGLVFKSPVTGKKISNIDRQFRNLIKHLALTHCKDNPLYQAYTILKAKEKTKEYISNLRWDDKLTKDIQALLDEYNGEKQGLIFENLEVEKFDKLSPHYMRNILVSMLAEQKTEAIVLSGILGHQDVNTINKYLSVNHYKSSQEGYKKIDEVIDVEVLND